MNSTQIIYNNTHMIGDDSWKDSLDTEAELAYNLFLYCGLISCTFTSTTLLIYMFKKELRMHPNGILIHLMITQFVISLKYLINGIVYRVKGGNLMESGYNDWSFGLMEDCTLESFMSMVFYTLYILWNLAWLWDLNQGVKYPMHTTEKYLFCYCIVVYFFGLVYVFVIYGIEAINEDFKIFTMVHNIYIYIYIHIYIYIYNNIYRVHHLLVGLTRIIIYPSSAPYSLYIYLLEDFCYINFDVEEYLAT